jgi:hypothetical protein
LKLAVLEMPPPPVLCPSKPRPPSPPAVVSEAFDPSVPRSPPSPSENRLVRRKDRVGKAVQLGAHLSFGAAFDGIGEQLLDEGHDALPPNPQNTVARSPRLHRISANWVLVDSLEGGAQEPRRSRCSKSFRWWVAK